MITANYTITLKETDRATGKPVQLNQAVILAENTQEERDRGFAFIRKVYPAAKQIACTVIAKTEKT
jgi:hypothetical protein